MIGKHVIGESSEKSFFDYSRYTDFVFKKHGRVHAEDKSVKDDFVEFMKEFHLYYKIFSIGFSIALSLYLLIRLLSNLFFCSSSKRNLHVHAPGKYYSNENASDWLDNFEFYVEEGGITSDAEKCGAFLSRMDGPVKTTLKNYDSRVKKDYTFLKNAFIKIYGKKKKPTSEWNFEFLACNQDNRNLYHYHAELCKLARKAFPTLTDEQRQEQIHERFISGLSNDLLRGHILASYKVHGLFAKIFGGKSLLDRAVELEEIYGKEQSNINFVKTDKINVTCYKCQNKGHYASECKGMDVNNNSTGSANGKNTQQKDQTSNQNGPTYQTNGNTGGGNSRRKKSYTANVSEQQKTESQVQSGSQANMFRLNRVSYVNMITGHCKVDNVSTYFLMDTGANKSVIDVKLFTEEQKLVIVPSPYKVVHADGTKTSVLGTKWCKVTLKDTSIDVEVLVTENLHEGCLLGMDFLSNHPYTKNLIDELQNVVGDTNINVNEVRTILENRNATSSQ